VAPFRGGGVTRDDDESALGIRNAGKETLFVFLKFS
jgi:hypothetical protein